MDELVRKLANPPKEYRPVPFWSWNDRLEGEMLRMQIREMDKAGLGGYFMHARGGLQTEYLSSEWMDSIQICIDEGNRLGMYSWCYDEEGWPSGFAGGAVTAVGDKFHVRWLEIEELTAGGDICPEDGVLGIYRYDTRSGSLERIHSSQASESLSEGVRIIRIRHKSNPYYIDILNKDVVKAFIETTYEKYYEKFKQYFGKGMPGFFTDEPQFARGQIPWSYILPQSFADIYGYDLLEVLPALFLECKGYEKVRYDFWQLVNELFTKAFGEQIYNWCEQHGCKFTGHVMMEDNLLSQMGATAGVMPFYEFMHYPGMDWLGRAIESPVIPKQVSSAANQLGKKFVLSETFALCGWDVSFEELKWIAEWQYVNGVSMMCQHLEGYTLRGLRKRDYPPSMFYQQSWWEEYKLFNDYFSRLGVLLTSGRDSADVLLLHPIRSAWITYNHSHNKELQKLDEDFVWATKKLSDMHIAHHYGDETIIGRHGKVEGDRFIVGQCEYRAVVMPSMKTLDKYTLELLKKFIANGGTVVSAGDFPKLYGGDISSDAVRGLQAAKCAGRDEAALYSLLKQFSDISIGDDKGEIASIHYQQRDLGNMQIFFMVNHDQKNTYNTVVSLKGEGRIIKFEAETGETRELASICKDDSTRLDLEFLPMQSHIIMLEKKEYTGVKAQESSPEAAEGQGPATIEEIMPEGEWDIERADLNSLTLDYCSYSIDKGEWVGPVPVIKLMRTLLALKRSCDIALKFNFEIDMDLMALSELFLAVETAGEFDICVNGTRLEYHDIGWWKDSAFKKVDIRSVVKAGLNEVVLKRRFYQAQKVYDVLFGENVLETEKNKLTYDVELESIYVVGDFGVKSKSAYSYGDRKAIFTDGPFVIVDKPKTVRSGNLTEQGFCFFAGSITLGQNINVQKTGGSKVMLKLEKPNCILSKVHINGKAVKVLPWAPFEADINGFVNEGGNRLSIQLFAGNRNLLGPHHHKRGELYAVCPTSFSDEKGWGPEDSEDQWRDRYCFVKFGI